MSILDASVFAILWFLIKVGVALAVLYWLIVGAMWAYVGLRLFVEWCGWSMTEFIAGTLLFLASVSFLAMVV